MKISHIKHSVIVSILFFVLTATVLTPTAAAGFRFVAWGDTKGGTSTLAILSNQAKAMSPALTIYAGDAISSGTVLTGFVNAINGGNNNGMLDKSFLVRGNHDSDATSPWQSTFEFAQTASRIGATNYTALNTDLTYSFDYQNAHFIGIDNLGNATGISPAQITFIDQELTKAEQRGIKHAFLFWHGPTYTVDDHMASVNTALTNMMNNHSIISATFHGHEHVETHTTINSTRIPQITRYVYEQFVTGTAGAGAYGCASGRSDYCQTYQGFVVIDVLSDTQFKAGFYKQSVTTPQWEQTFTKNRPPSGSPPPATRTPTPTQRPSISPTKTPTPGGKPGDCGGPNGTPDGYVDLFDYGSLSRSFGLTQGQTGFNAKCDFYRDSNNIIDLLDYGILAQNFGR